MSKYLALRQEVEQQKSLPGNDACLKFGLHGKTYGSSLLDKFDELCLCMYLV